MKALTIHQPYASLIVQGDKIVENRTWLINHRGPLAIHAAAKSNYLMGDALEGCITSAIVGIADVVGCEYLVDLEEMEPDNLVGARRARDIVLHDHTEGPVCLIFGDVMDFWEPIPCRGYQGLWDWKS